MAVAYLAVGALTYVLLARTGLNISLVLLLSVLSGPVLGTGGLLVIVYWRARKSRLHAVPSINPGNSDLMK